MRLHQPQCCGNVLLTRGLDGYFSAADNSIIDHFYRRRLEPWWDTSPFGTSALSTHFDVVISLAADPRARKLFVVSQEREHGELVRYDLSARSFTMMLPGASADQLDITRDRNMFAYEKSSRQDVVVEQK